MENLKYLYLVITAALLGALSFICFKQWRRIEDLYDDALDAKAEAKVNKARAEVATLRERYRKAAQEYAKTLIDSNDVTVTFIPDSPSLSSDSEEDLSSMRPGSDKLQ